MIRDQPALVLFSGGQDSATCLAWALERFAKVETIGFDYGQHHRVELECRYSVLLRLRREFRRWGTRLGEDHLVALPMIEAAPGALIPGRNLIFFTFAAAVGYPRDIRHLVGGMCETDHSGFPDCRDDTLKALQVALSLGLDRHFTIHTPLIWRSKRETWELAAALGGPELVAIIRDETHTCYLGERGTHHEWGCGCGECPACRRRADGWDSRLLCQPHRDETQSREA